MIIGKSANNIYNRLYAIFNIALIAFICIFTLYQPVCAADNTSEQESWSVINGGSVKVYYEQGVDLQVISRKIAQRGLFFGGVFKSPPDGTPQEKIIYSADRLVQRIKDILGMYPQLPDLTIRIFVDRGGMNKEYFKMFGVVVDYDSYYIHAFRTIFTSEDDISVSVMAHELGHAIIDSYFSIVPPSKVSEVLASYVDAHLED